MQRPTEPQKPSQYERISYEVLKFSSYEFEERSSLIFISSLICTMYLFYNKPLGDFVWFLLLIFVYLIYNIVKLFSWKHKSKTVPKEAVKYNSELLEYESKMKDYCSQLEIYENEIRNIVLKKSKEIEEQNRRKLDEQIKYETVIVVFATVEERGKSRAIIKRHNNTYAFIERPTTPFSIGENLKLPREKSDSFKWVNEVEYKRREAVKKQQALLLEQRLERQKKQSEYLESFGIEYLYHMTHKNNLQNILQKGLQSHNHAKINHLTQVDIADNLVNDRRSRLEPIYSRSIHDYVPFYFNVKNPMLFRRKNIQNEIVVLAIDKNVLHKDNTLFTNGNAASNATLFFKTTEDLNKLNWHCINAEYWNEIVDGKRIRCSEVLVYPNILTTSIQKIFCNNIATRQFVESKIINYTHIEVELNTNLYFSVNSNQQYNQNASSTNDKDTLSIDELDDLPF